MPATRFSPLSTETWEETDIRNSRCKHRSVRADASIAHTWMKGASTVPALLEWKIQHAGSGEFPAPFEVVRTSLSGAFFLACTGGEGRVFVDGSWKRCGPGEAVLLLPGVLNALHAVGKAPWRFCWLRYAEGASPLRHSGERMQLLAAYDPAPLQAVMDGLCAEASGRAVPHLLRRWCELAHECVRVFCQPAEADPRIARLWAEVEADLARPWAMEEMTAVACLSSEQLRRLCRRACGRSPRSHLMHLRMRRAAELLRSTHWTIERIAGEVGYRNAFVFSSTFKRLMGWSPSRYMAR